MKAQIDVQALVFARLDQAAGGSAPLTTPPPRAPRASPSFCATGSRELFPVTPETNKKNIEETPGRGRGRGRSRGRGQSRGRARGSGEHAADGNQSSLVPFSIIIFSFQAVAFKFNIDEIGNDETGSGPNLRCKYM